MGLSVFLQRRTSLEDDKIRKPPWKQGDYCTVQLWLSVKLMNLNFKDQLKAKVFSENMVEGHLQKVVHSNTVEPL